MSNAFISYVREDKNAVDLLAAELRREGVHVWLDRDDLLAGDLWEDSLRRALVSGSYFIACFSGSYESRDDTYMHQELALACDQYATRGADRAWLIPVLLSPCEIPPLPISGTRTLRDLQWVDLSQDWNTGIWNLLKVIRPPSVHPPDVDQWFRRLCEIHIKSKIDRAWSGGAFRTKDIEDGWRNLLLPSQWGPTLDLIVRLFERVGDRNEPLTERWVQPSDNGISILTTVSPTASSAAILRSLCPDVHSGQMPYEEFLRNERKILRGLVNWPSRDMAHWIFARDGEDVTVDLLFWPNLSDTLVLIGMLYDRSTDGSIPPVEMAYPGSLVTVTEMERIRKSIMLEEVRLLNTSV